MFVTICKTNQNTFWMQVNSTCFHHRKLGMSACDFQLWLDSQKPCFCWAASGCLWHSEVCHFCWGKCLCCVALLHGESFSKLIWVWGSSYPVLLPCFFPRCQASVDCLPSPQQPLVDLLRISVHFGTHFLQNLGVSWLLMNWQMLKGQAHGFFFFFFPFLFFSSSFGKGVQRLEKQNEYSHSHAKGCQYRKSYHNGMIKNNIKCIIHVVGSQTKPSYLFLIQDSQRGSGKGNNENSGSVIISTHEREQNN